MSNDSSGRDRNKQDNDKKGATTHRDGAEEGKGARKRSTIDRRNVLLGTTAIGAAAALFARLSGRPPKPGLVREQANT